MLDLILDGASIIDGSGRPAFQGAIGIRDGRIAGVGDLAAESAMGRIDLHGLTVAPGFIDSHTHSEIALLASPDAAPKARQGVTTEILGNCGFSPFPLAPASCDAFKNYSQPIFGHAEVAWDWTDWNGFAKTLERNGIGVNVATLAGHGALRAAVMGLDDRAPAGDELERMQKLLAAELDDGAFGLSTGLAYVPGIYAGTDELAALASVVGARGGLYATHVRDQVDGLVASVEEALEIGRRAQTPVLISHHKAVGSRNFGKVEHTLGLLDRARADGLHTYSDMYPYIAGMSTMTSVLPPWVVAGGLSAMLARLADPAVRARIARDIDAGLPGWENRINAVGWNNIVITTVHTEGNRDLEELTLAEAAVKRAKPVLDLLIDLLLEEGGKVGRITRGSCDEDMVRVLTHEHTMIGSDAIDAGRAHPRQYGTFPRVLGEMARERRLLSMETAVHKMTGLTARTFGLDDIGLLEAGRRADLVVFDPALIKDTATYAQPCTFPVGLDAVMVGGVWSVRDGRMTGQLNGRVLRKRVRRA